MLRVAVYAAATDDAVGVYTCCLLLVLVLELLMMLLLQLLTLIRMLLAAESLYGCSFCL